ncbi:MAG: helix-turn-helix domain-containing protein [Rhodobiaceae bacterium]|nr:helix-turn-helix domain-containing protein [Rhodobiaceae bacterium]
MHSGKPLSDDKDQFTERGSATIVVAMDTMREVPQFHLYGEAADEQAFDFIHAEPITVRSSENDWVINPHSHRYLHQVMYIADGSVRLTVETNTTDFGSNTLIVLAPNVVHSYQFSPNTEGMVLSFTDDVIRGFADTSGSLSDRLAAVERAVVVPLDNEKGKERISGLAHQILEELEIGPDGSQIAIRSYLALLIVEISRLGIDGSRWNTKKPKALDDTVSRLRQLVEDNFRETRHLSAYAEWLAMTPDRLNEHCKKVTGVTAGHLIRQRLLVEAKRQLIFTGQSVSEIAYSLNFSDPSYFSRFFRKYSGQTPQQFRDHRR